MMHVSRGVFDVETAVRKLSSRFRRPTQVVTPEWPVISATRSLFYVIRFFGLVPFQVSEGRFIPENCSMVYSLFWTGIHTYTIYTVLISFDALKKTSRNVVDITETAKVIINYCIVMFNILMAVWTRKQFIGVLNIIKHFDSRMRDIGYPRKEVATRIWAWSTCLCSGFVWTVVNRTGMYAFSESWFYNMAYIVNYVASSFSVIKFSSVVLLLAQRFRHLNKIAQCSKEYDNTKQNHVRLNFKVIQQLHSGLMNAGESLCCQYSWPLLLWLMNLSAHSVSNLYFAIAWLTKAEEWSMTRWPLVICEAWWLFTFVAQLLLLHVACHFASAEANSMGSIVTDWKSLIASRNYRVQSSLHFMNRKLDFSAAGCFFVNLPLLRSIAALLTTYVVLLLQFQS